MKRLNGWRLKRRQPTYRGYDVGELADVFASLVDDSKSSTILPDSATHSRRSS